MCKCSVTCDDLSLWHREPWRFVTTRWQHPGRKSYSYICYRLTVAAFFFVWTIIDMCTYGVGSHSRWLIHITNWSKLFVMLDTLLQALLTCHYQLWKLRTRPPGAPVMQEVRFNAAIRFFYAVEWFFTNVSGVFAVVTVWVAFLEEDSSGAFRAARYFTSLLYVVADHLVHNQPKHMLHVFYPLFLHVAYIVFNAIYVLAGGRTASGSSVIDGLDWGRTATALGVLCTSVFLVFVAHAALWLLARLREVLYSCVSEHSAIKLPLAGAGAGTAGTPPYGATRQDPEGGHPSPLISEKPRPAHSPAAGVPGESPDPPPVRSYSPAGSDRGYDGPAAQHASTPPQSRDSAHGTAAGSRDAAHSPAAGSRDQDSAPHRYYENGQ